MAIFEIYESVLDMIAKYKENKVEAGSDLQDDEVQRLEDIVGGLRKKWEEHQRDLHRGEPVSQDDIQNVEHIWIRSFETTPLSKVDKKNWNVP